MIRNILNIIYRIFRNIFLRNLILTKIFFKLDSTRSPNREFFSSKYRSLERSIEYSYNTFNKILDELKILDKNYSLMNKRILEIGPGDNFLLAYIFLINGAKCVYLLDRFKSSIKESYNVLLFKNYLKKYKNYNEKQFSVLKKKVRYLSYAPIDNFKTLPKIKFDLIISQAVLEHVFNLDSTIKNIASILKRGGYTTHHIDLKDHIYRNEGYYLDFLKYSSNFWMIFGDITNRVRYPQYINLFKQNGFEILKVTKNRVGPLSRIENLKTIIHKEFQNIDVKDLSISSFRITAVKL